eukprot:Pgem_evm1s15581
MNILLKANPMPFIKHVSKNRQTIFNTRNLQQRFSMLSRGKKVGLSLATVTGVFYSVGHISKPLPQVTERPYYWIHPEAEELIAKNYCEHKVLADSKYDGMPDFTVEEMERMNRLLLNTTVQEAHFEPQTMSDSVAASLMYSLETLMHLFFRDKYDHHAVTLETLAAIPGFVASSVRHLRSLRTMEVDNEWIVPLQEEAENERMHLMIWMAVTNPSWLERQFVVLAQGVYLSGYTMLYFCAPKVAHRMVGYLEEAAFSAYTEYYEALDKGEIPNRPCPVVGQRYYKLPKEATLKDLVLRIRADECMHRDFNHELSNMYLYNQESEIPHFMTTEHGKFKVPTGPWWRSSSGTFIKDWKDEKIE